MTTAPAATDAPAIRVGDRKHAALLGSIGLAALALVGWQIASELVFVIPAPLATVRTLLANLTTGSYLVDAQVTFQNSLVAFLLGALIGGAAGLVLGLSRWARIVFEPLLIALNGLPKIVLYPVLLPIFHLSGAKVVMGLMFALFPILINVAIGVRELPPVYRKLARSVNASGWQTLVHIILPAIRRPLLTGVRLSVSLAVVGVVLSEFFATRRGLGRVVLQAYSSGDYLNMMATILLLVSVSFVLSLLLWRWERRMR
ncbi:MAG TPA: ABC transporter permease subunit [Pseudonocardia sp.]|uniref:ABC transporter permease n=1 Tax=Pseudonocardia sp. TaxID=60912 RepID=UPI002C777EDD|nr:ABC transporter permease subunit [Pseudonocardia sp.]HTF46677.1 ABC transporter permease subunit [Pseudonocardia sp.]